MYDTLLAVSPSRTQTLSSACAKPPIPMYVCGFANTRLNIFFHQFFCNLFQVCMDKKTIKHSFFREIEKIKKTINKSLEIARPVSTNAFFNGRLWEFFLCQILNYNSLRPGWLKHTEKAHMIILLCSYCGEFLSNIIIFFVY